MLIPAIFRSTALRFLLTLGCMLALSQPSAADRKVRAIFITSDEAVLEKAMLFTGTQYTEIELPHRNFSPAVDLPDGDLLVAILPKALAAGEVVPADAPKIKIPAAWERCILLFFPAPANKVFPARVIPVNASTADFPKGYTLIYNISNAAILGKFGDELVAVNPGKSVSFKPPISKFGDYPVAIDCTFPGDTKPTSICRSSWQHDPDVRQFMFVTPAPGFKVPRVWGVLDRQEGETKIVKNKGRTRGVTETEE